MEIFSALIVVPPLIVPVALGFGVDPVHLGIIFLTNLEIAFLTPPLGLNLFISSYRFNHSVLKISGGGDPVSPPAPDCAPPHHVRAGTESGSAARLSRLAAEPPAAPTSSLSVSNV